ncbi:hypothetical protein [Elioraea sp.]|uniref:hypothetical protein n=1 Tax=Elioraea sp. TaxID=2185103 RepID=UPI003F7219E4
MPAWVLHDARRTGVTWLAGTGFATHVADHLLNHISGVAAVNQGGEFMSERKAALDAWGAHVTRCATGQGHADNLVALPRRHRGSGHTAVSLSGRDDAWISHEHP